MNNAITKKHTGFFLNVKETDGFNSIFILAACFMLYHINQYLNLALLLLIVMVFISNIKKDIFYMYYFAMIFFEPIMILPFDLGSLFRIYQLIFLCKIIIEYKNRTAFNKLPLHKVILAMILITWALVQGMSTSVSMVINLIILLHIFSSFTKRKDENYSLMLFIIFLFATLSGFYGLFNGNEVDGRISGTIGDANYSALFYLLGFFSLLGTEVITSLRIKVILSLIIFIFMLMTISLQGILGFVLLSILYFLVKNKKVAIIMMLLIIIFAVIVYYLPIETRLLYGIKYRAMNSIQYFIAGDYSMLTSNRTDLFNDYLLYFFSQNNLTIFFGGQNIVFGYAREYTLNRFSYISHNSYIDMLYAVGFVGTIYILGCFVYDIINNLKSYKTSNKEYYLAIVFLKLTILWFSLGLSMFPFRYFLTFMFL